MKRSTTPSASNASPTLLERRRIQLVDNLAAATHAKDETLIAAAQRELDEFTAQHDRPAAVAAAPATDGAPTATQRRWDFVGWMAFTCLTVCLSIGLSQIMGAIVPDSPGRLLAALANWVVIIGACLLGRRLTILLARRRRAPRLWVTTLAGIVIVVTAYVTVIIIAVAVQGQLGAAGQAVGS